MTKSGDTGGFQFHYTYVDDGEVQHIIGWGHPTLIQLLAYNQTAVFIDGTFYCVPTPFYQCIVVMVHDQGSKCFVPFLYCLTTNKTYWNTLHCVKAAAKMNMDVGTTSCDFERAIINAVKDQFSDATVIGCLFHFKQAIRRKMLKLHISTEEIEAMMKRGYLDSLTVITHARIDPQGLQYVIEKFRETLDEQGIQYSSAKWADFWQYFRKTWIKLFPPTLWNIHGIRRTIGNRTNNPLEHYNRELNNAFSSQRPNLASFIGTIESHAARYATLFEGISVGRTRVLKHGTYVVPPDFTL